MSCRGSIRCHGPVESLHFTSMEPVVSVKHLTRGGSQVQGMTPDILLANQGYEYLLIGVVQ